MSASDYTKSFHLISSQKVSFTFDGKKYLGFKGETIASALLRNNVKFLRKENFICNQKLESCHIITNDGYKIFWDNSHFTLEGAKYFGKKIHQMNWLNLD